MNAPCSGKEVVPAMDAPRSPHVSVVIPCRNEARHIESCIRSVLAQQSPEGGFEIVIADGMSQDDTRDILARFRTLPSASPPCGCSPRVTPAIRVVENPRKITAAGLNAAIAVAQGDIIVRMDAHTEYAEDYICQCVRVLEHTGADNVGGPARTRADTYLERAIAAAYHSAFAVGGALFHNLSYEGWTDTVTYGCWHKLTFERFGFFDEELVRNQDDEHNLRIIRGGGRIWQSPEIRSWYRTRGSLRSLFKQYMQYGYWKVRVIQKHRLPASLRHLVPGAFVLTLMSLLLTCPLSLALSGLAPWLSSVSIVTGGLFLFLVALYFVCVCGASVMTAAGFGWKLLPILPPVFACYHFGYGYGFLRGIWDFVLRRRRPQTGFVTLTR